MQDIKISTQDINFKTRVNGIIIVDNKLLTVQMNNNGFYCLPGGHIEIGENSKMATIREIQEEVGIQTSITSLVSIAENFFERKNGKKFHELSFYYLLKPLTDIKTVDYEVIEKDKNQEILLQFKWLDVMNLNNYSFRPEYLKEKIIKNDFKFCHIID